MTEISAALELGVFTYLFASQSNAEVKLISNYPIAWTSLYLANSYQEIDPVINRSGLTGEPFEWGCERWYRQLGNPQIQLIVGVRATRRQAFHESLRNLRHQLWTFQVS